MSNNIKKELIEFICKNYMVSEDELDCDQSLIDQDIVDSFGLVELSMFIQKEFGFTVEETALNKENFGSVNCMVNFIEKSIKNLSRV